MGSAVQTLPRCGPRQEATRLPWGIPHRLVHPPTQRDSGWGNGLISREQFVKVRGLLGVGSRGERRRNPPPRTTQLSLTRFLALEQVITSVT